MSLMVPPPNADPRPRLLIIGCSTRAAAWSAVRAGFRPVCADQFVDEDLRQIADVLDFDSLWNLRQSQLAHVVSDAWMFVGGMENDLTRLRQFDGDRRKYGVRLGIEPKHLSALRQPELLQQAAEIAGITPLAVTRTLSHSPVDNDVVWVRKKFASGGGIGIKFQRPPDCDEHLSPAEYLQEFFEGRAMSAIFLISDTAVKLVGFTEQLVGDSVSAATSPFVYCGNIAPLPLPFWVGERLRSALSWLREVGLQGLCGIDFLWSGSSLRLVEVNPRYTAACELLDYRLGRSLVSLHAECWGVRPDSDVPRASSTLRDNRSVVGKLILYARSSVVAPDLSRFLRPRSPWTVPFLADIPRVGTRFEPGQPMCTVFATGRDADAVRRKLYRRADRVRQWFGDLS